MQKLPNESNPGEGTNMLLGFPNQLHLELVQPSPTPLQHLLAESDRIQNKSYLGAPYDDRPMKPMDLGPIIEIVVGSFVSPTFGAFKPMDPGPSNGPKMFANADSSEFDDDFGNVSKPFIV